MTLFFQSCGVVILAVILILMLHGSREMGTILSIAASAMAALIALNYLSPVMEFLETLETLGNLDGNLIEILLKAAGIGILTEIAALVCSDAGNASLGKAVQLLGTAAILWLSLPLFSALTQLLESILGEL